MPPKKPRAATKTRGATAKSLPPPPPSADKVVAEDDVPAEELLDQLHGELAPLNALQQKFFARQQPEPRAIELGTRTSAALYTRAALRVYVQITDASEKHPAAFKGFTPALRRWFLDQLVFLRAAVAERAARAQGTGAISVALQAAMVPARGARNALLTPLELAVEGVAEDEQKLAAARGDTALPTNLVQSLRALATLGDAIVGRSDELTQMTLSESGLEARHVREARAAAETLQKAIDADTQLGRKDRVDRDTPAMNIFEGRATLSLRRARKIYVAARLQQRTLPPLQIPKALSRVLGTPPSARKSSDAKPTPAPDPAP